MLDLKFIRENPEVVRQAIANRQDTAPLDEILQFDGERRQKMTELEELRRNRKQASRERQVDAAEKGRAPGCRIGELRGLRRDRGVRRGRGRACPPFPSS